MFVTKDGAPENGLDSGEYEGFGRRPGESNQR